MSAHIPASNRIEALRLAIEAVTEYTAADRTELDTAILNDLCGMLEEQLEARRKTDPVGFCFDDALSRLTGGVRA